MRPSPTAGRATSTPRSDYEIVEDSWQVVGLKGTGSKDLVVRDSFVPAYRVIDTEEITEGTAGVTSGRENPLYAMPRNVMFAGAVTAATIGISKGVLDAFIELVRVHGRHYGKASLDPYQLAALGECAADIDASIRHFLSDIDRVHDICAAGQPTPLSLRAEVRRNQVRASNRAVAAADKLFRIAGGVSLREDLPLERLWRDSQAAIHHVQNVQDPIMQAYGLDFFGHPVPRPSSSPTCLHCPATTASRSHPMPVAELGHVGVRVDDLPLTRPFHTEMTGLVVVDGDPEKGLAEDGPAYTGAVGGGPARGSDQ